MILITPLSMQPHPIPDDYRCSECDGHRGFDVSPDPHNPYDCSPDWIECETCFGTGLNTLGFIMCEILTPPKDGCGPVDLEQVMQYRRESECHYRALDRAADRLLKEIA